jgi:hypothetical protein
MEWTVLLGGLGLGAIITKIVDYFLTKKSSKEALLYKEKKEVYFGLLDALHKAAVSPSIENSKNFALWQTRVQLFGTDDVAKSVQGMIDTNDGPKNLRDKHFKELIEGMRKDLNR